MAGSNFLARLKKRYAVKVDPSHTEAQLKQDYRAEVDAFLRGYLDALDESLEKINSRATAFFDQHDHQSVGGQDTFSKNFEKEVAYEILKWVATDETLRAMFKKLQAAYRKKLKSADMEEILDESLAAFEKDLAEHVAKANAYGRSWGDRMDKIGIVAVLKETRMTIKWFKNLTVEELRRSFKE